MDRKNRKNHGIDAEPNFTTPAKVDGASGSGPTSVDPTEQRSEQRLAREAVRRDRDREDAQHAVDNEPAMFPEGAVHDPVLDRDWPCEKCGYNLRTRRIGTPCPECNHVQFWAPSRADRPGYAQWLDNRVAAARATSGWLLIIGIALLGAPWGLLGGLCAPALPGTGATLLFEPVADEMLKVALLLTLLEVQPFRIRSEAQIWVAGLLSALLFAVGGNLFMLIIPMPYTEQFWRWSVVVALHVGCSGLICAGMVRSWRACLAEKQPPRLSTVFPWMLAAALIHGIYDLLMYYLGIYRVTM